METERFDALAKVVGSTPSRRATLRAGLGSLVALAGLANAAVATKRRTGVKPEACIPTGKACPAPKPRGRGANHKKRKVLSCKQCCQRHVETDANGTKRCSCRPAGLACEQPFECCSGVCAGGTCGGARTQPVPPPPSSPPPPPCICSQATCCDVGEQCCPQFDQGGETPIGSICCGSGTSCACEACVPFCPLDTPFQPCHCNCPAGSVTCTLGTQQTNPFTCCLSSQTCCRVGGVDDPNTVNTCCDVLTETCVPGTGCVR